MIIATRKGVDPQGNSWEESVIRTGEDAFRLEVRSDDPSDCFDTDMNLQQLHEYTGQTAVQPFVWAVVASS